MKLLESHGCSLTISTPSCRGDFAADSVQVELGAVAVFEPHAVTARTVKQLSIDRSARKKDLQVGMSFEVEAESADCNVTKRLFRFQSA